MMLRTVTAEDAPALSALHGPAFDRPWSPDEIAAMLAQPGHFGLLADGVGFILCRVVADEAEVLTLAVDPAARRQGVASALLEAARGVAKAAGAGVLFLEVAADNDPALALYERAGFAWAGLRRGYYARTTGAMDAIVMRLELNSRA